MRGTGARIGAESVCLLSGAGLALLPWFENFRRLCTAITANPPRPRASPLAHSDLVAGPTSCGKAGLRLVQDVAPPFRQPMTRGLSKSHVGSSARKRKNIQGQRI